MITLSRKEFFEKNTMMTELEYILDYLPPLHKDGPWIAGGSLMKTYMGLPLEDSDVDVWITPEKHKKWRDYKNSKSYDNGMDNPFPEIFNKKDDENDKLKTYTEEINGNRYNIQCIMFGNHSTPEELINSFDLNICQFAFDGETVYIGDSTLESIRTKYMKFVKFPKNKGNVLKRVVKYANRGFMLDRGQLNAFSVAEFNNEPLDKFTSDYKI